MPAAKKKVLDTIGKRIAQARRELGVRDHRDVKPSDLAEMVGVSETTLYRWENDEKAPSDENLAKLADVLGVNRSWLKFDEGEKSPNYLPSGGPVQPIPPKPKSGEKAS